MKITDIFKLTPRTFSFEFFPPKDEISAVDFGINIGRLLKLNPSFVTVTYGAGGSTQERTFALVDYLQNKIGLNTMAHYTCVDAPKEKIIDDLRILHECHIENLMVLRGDPPNGTKHFNVIPNGFAHANELMYHIKQLPFNFCIGGGAYPDKHPEAASLEEDIQHLKKKITAGAEFLITQLFFDNKRYFDFVSRCRAEEITNRIIPGIIPITAYSQLSRFSGLSNAIVPEALQTLMEQYKNQPKKIYQIGMDFAIQQCRDLLLMGAPGIHFYTLNKSRATVEIFETLIK